MFPETLNQLKGSSTDTQRSCQVVAIIRNRLYNVLSRSPDDVIKTPFFTFKSNPPPSLQPSFLLLILAAIFALIMCQSTADRSGPSCLFWFFPPWHHAAGVVGHVLLTWQHMLVCINFPFAAVELTRPVCTGSTVYTSPGGGGQMQQ